MRKKQNKPDINRVEIALAAKQYKRNERALPSAKMEDGKLFNLSGDLFPVAELDETLVHVFNWVGGILEWVDTRRLSGKQVGKDGSMYGSVSLRCERVRVDLFTVETKHGARVVAIVPEATSRHSTPLRMDTMEDVTVWNKRGMDGALSAIGWARFLNWRGTSAREAARQIIARRTAIVMGKQTLPECPLVIFPSYGGLSDQGGKVDVMIQRIEAIERAEQELMSRIYEVERLRVSDIETLRNLSWEMERLRELALSRFEV
jgi:hypothetical protein